MDIGHSWLAVMLLALVAGTVFAADPLAETLQKGLFEEEANHNLEAAIKAYQSVIDQSQEQRRIAATALFRLGECYRKLNKTNEAAGYYQRLLRDFSDQTMLANLSKQNLSVLGVSKAEGKTVLAEVATDEEGRVLERIRVMIKDSPDLINGRKQGGVTPLHAAALAGQMSVARFLLANGANINVRDNMEGTALHRAAWAGHRSMCELLLTNGADPNIMGRYVDGVININVQGTPLHLAVRNGYQGVTETLLQHKADPNVVDTDRQTALHLASRSNGSVGLVELLLKHGADVNAADKDRDQPLHVAAAAGAIPVAKLLIGAGAKLDQRGQYGNTPLHSAIKPGRSAMVRYLLEAGADVNARRDGGVTVVYAAAQQNADDVLKELLAFKPNLELQTDYGSTPLMAAINSKAAAAVELLLKAGANPNGQDGRTGDFPLLFAIRTGQTEIVRSLLAHKADPNVVHPEGTTALAAVRAFGYSEPSSRAIRTIRSSLPSGVTAEAIREIEALLIQHGADQNIERRRHIALTREGHGVWNFFTRTRHGDKQYTLLELLGFYYQGRNPQSTWTPHPFPDLANITIERLVDGGKATNRIPAALDKEWVDVPLQWGDVVIIPEKDHTINETWPGFAKDVGEDLASRVLKRVDIHVHGKAKSVVHAAIQPELVTNLSRQSGLPVRITDGIPRLHWPTLQYVVSRSGVLRASSDTARVKVIRREPDGKKFQTLVFNLNDESEDLWLQDGDVIEIPTKES